MSYPYQTNLFPATKSHRQNRIQNKVRVEVSIRASIYKDIISNSPKASLTNIFSKGESQILKYNGESWRVPNSNVRILERS